MLVNNSEVFNYYAYGMLIPGFFSNATPDYRFGFNGMLRDDDVRYKEGEIYNKNIGEKEIDDDKGAKKND